MDACGSLQAPLFVVHLHDRGDRLNRAYEDGLQTLADATGGRSAACRSVGEIPEAVSDAFSRISNAWRVTLTIPHEVHSVAQVRLSARSGQEDLRLSWRTHFNAKERH